MSRVLVAGSINIDLVARVAQHPRPGQTVSGSDLRSLPGGKGANQAVAAALAGATTAMAGMVGDDDAGRQLLTFLSSSGVDVQYVSTTSGPTGTALIVVDDEGENTIVVVPGANDQLTPDACGQLAMSAGDVLVAQLEVPLPAVEAVLRLGRAAGATTVLNAAPAPPAAAALFHQADVLVVNETELAAFVGSHVPAGRTQVQEAARGLRERDDQIVVVTLGSAGVCAVRGQEDIAVDGRHVPVVDTTGAGDCFVGALAARLAAGDDLRDALTFANVAASLSVQRHGAGSSMPDEADVLAALLPG